MGDGDTESDGSATDPRGRSWRTRNGPDRWRKPCSRDRETGLLPAQTLGADEGTRTPNHLFTRQVRYRLRHVGEVPTYGRSRSRGSRRNVVPEERPETVDGGSRTSPADSGTSGRKGR